MAAKEQFLGGAKADGKQRSPQPPTASLERSDQTVVSGHQHPSAAPYGLFPQDVLQLQRTMGNQVTSRLLAQATQRQPRVALHPTLPTKDIIQPKFIFEGEKFPEAEDVIRATPFTKKEQIALEESPWNLLIIFGDFGKEAHGATGLVKDQKNTIRMKLN